MIELTELVWETEIGGLVVGVDESRCVVLRWEYPQHTVSDIQALIEALKEARRHVACDACGSDPCVCAGLQEQAEKAEAEEHRIREPEYQKWLARKQETEESDEAMFMGSDLEWSDHALGIDY